MLIINSFNGGKIIIRETLPGLQAYCHRGRHFQSSATVSRSSLDKFTVRESLLLRCLSQHRIDDVRNLLEKIPGRSTHYRVACWTSILTKFARSGFVGEAYMLFDTMPERNVVTYNAMLSGFLRQGMFSEAKKLFEEMPERNVVSWTSMVCGLADSGEIAAARVLFERMPEKNIVSWNAMVSRLIRSNNLEDARSVFDKIPAKNLISWNTMIWGYGENGRMKEGYHLFQRTPEKDAASWVAVIGGFARNGLSMEALVCFLEMRRCSIIRPTGEIFISLAHACADVGFHQIGRQLHAQAIINGFDRDDHNGKLSKSLIRMYSSLGSMDYAQYIFDKNSNSSELQSCNCMITGYIRIGDLESAENLFDGLQIRDKITWTSMIVGYFTIGNVSKACALFDSMSEKDEVAWTAMVSGLVENELFDEATYFFSEMLANGHSPLTATYSSLLGAAGALARLDKGKQLHAMLVKTQSHVDMILDGSLISMYAKCGEIHDACRVFCNMVSHDLISWNSMIMGFAHHGLAAEALEIFAAMVESGTRPNSLTFLGILSACGHAGLVDRGQKIFQEMKDVHGVQPGLEHCVAMVDLLGRAGRVREAEEFIYGSPFERNKSIWGALLGASWVDERSSDIARRAAKQLLELDPNNTPAHIVICNAYAARGRHGEVQKLRKKMSSMGLKKVPGCSWVLVGGRVRAFLSGDKLPSESHQALTFLFDCLDESYVTMSSIRLI